jgi:hypothetical protein
MTSRYALGALLACCVAGCSGSSGSSTPAPPAKAIAGTQVLFDLDADLSSQSNFYHFPYPSDLRLSAQGKPDLRGFPNPANNAVIENLLPAAEQHPDFPVVPVAYFEFDAALPKLTETNLIAAAPSSPILLVDVDPSSPNVGQLIATVANTPPNDQAYVPDNLLAVAAYPGIVLEPNRTYAFVVMRSLDDAAGQPLGVPLPLAQLEAGQTPDGSRGAAAAKLYAPLWTALKRDHVDPRSVAAATVFTTGDVVQQIADISDALLKKYAPSIQGLKLDTSTNSPRFCELTGTITYPQFQTGTPPFDTGGLFALDESGVPIEQRTEVAPMVITLPKTKMPAEGYPLVIYFHGSGGLSTQVVDRGPRVPPGGPETPGEGPAYVLEPFGFAAAGSAMPLNPERLPGASETEYINFKNLAALRDTFRQGVIEERLFIRALANVRIDPSVIAGCSGPTLPAGATTFKLSEAKLLAMGQSMGGMYTNMIGAVEPKILAVVPTGAGGFWSDFITKTSVFPGLSSVVGNLLGIKVPLTFLHPSLSLLETAWGPAEPMAYMARLARRPLSGSPVRPVYEPVGQGDSYFPSTLYDAIVLAYGHKEAGDVIWPDMQASLKVEGLGGIVPYPVKNDVQSESGQPYTGVVVQYKGDGVDDPHEIFQQLDSVKYQYGCFFKSFYDTGTAVVPAPAPLGTPCPE